MYENDSIIKRDLKKDKHHQILIDKALDIKSRMSSEEFKICQEEILLKMFATMEKEIWATLITSQQTQLFDSIEDIEATIKRLMKKYDEIWKEEDYVDFLKEFTPKAFECIKTMIKHNNFTL